MRQEPMSTASFNLNHLFICLGRCCPHDQSGISHPTAMLFPSSTTLSIMLQQPKMLLETSSKLVISINFRFLSQKVQLIC